MPRRRRSTLGPFPKTLRFRELAGRFQPQADPDKLIEEIRRAYDALAKDAVAGKPVVFLASLPVCSRFHKPSAALREHYGIEICGRPSQSGLVKALNDFTGSWPTPAAGFAPHLLHAAERTIQNWLAQESSRERLLDAGPWAPWRAADSSAFCDLGRELFTQLNKIAFSQILQAQSPDIDVFSEEMSLITRTFSARWFNALARNRVPEEGSIRWYLAHCLGKLDLELSRERSDWVEEPRKWKSRQPRLFDVA